MGVWMFLWSLGSGEKTEADGGFFFGLLYHMVVIRHMKVGRGRYFASWASLEKFFG